MLNTITAETTAEAHRPVRPREGEDRRHQPDRRRSSVDMRLRVGLWYQYHRATRAGEFDPFPRTDHKRDTLLEALLPEIVKYHFAARETGSDVAAHRALSDAVGFLWSYPKLGCNAAGESMAVYVVNAVAEYLCRTFVVETIDRRKNDRRAAKAAPSVA